MFNVSQNNVTQISKFGNHHLTRIFQENKKSLENKKEKGCFRYLEAVCGNHLGSKVTLIFVCGLSENSNNPKKNKSSFSHSNSSGVSLVAGGTRF